MSRPSRLHACITADDVSRSRALVPVPPPPRRRAAQRPHRRYAQSARNKWTGTLSRAVVIIKRRMPQSRSRSISNDYARLNGGNYDPASLDRWKKGGRRGRERRGGSGGAGRGGRTTNVLAKDEAETPRVRRRAARPGVVRSRIGRLSSTLNAI